MQSNFSFYFLYYDVYGKDSFMQFWQLVFLNW